MIGRTVRSIRRCRRLSSGVFAVGEILEGHGRPDADLAGRNVRLFNDAGGPELLLQLVDAALDLLLLFLGGVVFGVFLEVALFGGLFDFRGQLTAPPLQRRNVVAKFFISLPGQERFTGHDILQINGMQYGERIAII